MSRMHAILTIAALAMSLPAAAQEADNWSCTLGELARRVEIIYEPGRAVPCEVHYYKDVEMPEQDNVLWRAAHESGYCEARAAELVARLESQGWSCAAGVGAARPDEAPDDTEALAPGNDDTA